MKHLLVVWTALLALAGPAYAASSAAQQLIVVHVEPAASLTLDPETVSFPPDSLPVAGRIAQTGTVNIEASARTSDSGAVTLTALAAGDLKSGENTIPIDALSWNAGGLGYSESGILSDTQAQTVGSWSHSGVYDGSIAYTLTSEWDYAAGTYTTTITYTLTAL
jgi:hypothetical protein